MKIILFHLALTCFFLSCCSRVIAQSNPISVTLLGNSLSNNDTAKCMFGLNRTLGLIHRTDSDENSIYLIAYKGSQYKIGNGNWVTMPIVDAFPTDDYGTAIPIEDTIHFYHDVKFYNSYYDENYSLNSFATTGGLIDFRLIFSTRKAGFSDSVIYSSPLHILVPPALQQDVSALQYISQQKETCPELIYFFSNSFCPTLKCYNTYEYLSTNFSDSILGKMSKQRLALISCKLYGPEINDMLEIKASIKNAKDILLDSDIEYLKDLAKYLICVEN